MGGINKGLLELCGKTFVEILMDEFSSLGRVYIVGKKKEFLDFGAEVYDDLIEGKGPLSGLLTALVFSHEDWILLLPCDMPLLKKELAFLLMDAAMLTSSEAAALFTDRVTPVPGLFQRGLKERVKRRLEEGRLSMTDFILSVKSVLVHGKGFENLKTVNSIKDYEKLAGSVDC